MRVIVVNDLSDLAGDMRAIPKQARKDMRATVAAGLRVGKSLARDYAKAGAGPHGVDYYKRITSEMYGDVTFGGVTGIAGEYGPEGIPKTDFVGVGFRHGVNRDLPRSADMVGPALAGEVSRLPDRWFW